MEWLTEFKQGKMPPMGAIQFQKSMHVHSGFTELVKEVFDCLPEHADRDYVLGQLLAVKNNAILAIAQVPLKEAENEEPKAYG